MFSQRKAPAAQCLGGWITVLAFLILAAGCASHPPAGGARVQQQTNDLREHLRRLDSSVNADEAALLAETAVQAAVTLAGEYRAVRPAWWGNWLVNAGWREHGLCYQWANDLFPRLHALNLRTLKLHFAVAHMDKPREHNSLVVTASLQPFEEGLVLDAWRNSGQLWFGRVDTDKYPWKPLPSDRVAPELRKLADENAF